MIPAKVFAKDAAGLVPGAQVRINHDDCPAGKDTRGRLYVKRKDEDTLLAYCHNCGDYGIKSTKGKVKAIRDLLIEHEAIKRDEAGELVLPEDIIFNWDKWPKAAFDWVYGKYGISWEEVQSYGIGYSPSWHRVILPVYEGGKLVFWQGRALETYQDPKYISAKSHPKVMFWANATANRYNKGKVFIVEDMLSAIKMSRFADSVALLGTSPDFDGLSSRLTYYNKVGILLDPDLAGIQKAHELQARMSLVFMGQVRRFIEIKQPKEMTNAELEALASGL